MKHLSHSSFSKVWETTPPQAFAQFFNVEVKKLGKGLGTRLINSTCMLTNQALPSLSVFDVHYIVS